MEALTTATVGNTGVKGPRQFQGLFDVIPFTFNIEEDSVGAEDSAQADFTIPGAELGDFVFVALGVDAVSLQAYAFVAAADTVTIGVQNLETADANTTLATVSEGNGFILKPKRNVLEWGP
jgi:hypothetical protein